jgi:DNA processing protein
MASDPAAADLGLWLRLVLTPGIGPIHARRLLERFGSPLCLFESDGPALAAFAGERLARLLQSDDGEREQQVAQTLEWARAESHHLITFADADYPRHLLQIDDAPPLLHGVGRRDILSRPMLAMVGARNATAAGAANARSFARALSGAGWTIASGLALGIDAAAHEGALQGGAGTVAVVGTGADILYPSRHRGLADRIAADGLILSELPLGTPPSAGLFPRRNRLIAGLSHGVLVVEAALRSGSLITARQAGEFGREVFAIPGSIHSPLSRGCHALIRQGALLVESAREVIDELPALPARRDLDTLAPPEINPDLDHPHRSSAGGPSLAPDDARRVDQDPVIAAIGHDPVQPDILAAHLGLAPGELGARLVILELDGLIRRLSDGRVQRLSPSG